MRAPDDDSSTDTLLTTRPRERPRGGSPMLRLLDLLGRQGYGTLAEEAAARAVAPGERAAALELARTLDLLPDDPAATPTPGAPTPGAHLARGDDSAGGPGPDPGDVARAYAEVADDLTGPPTPTGPQWRSLGPWTITNGQTYGSSRVNVSGRISALAVDPSSPAHVLAGAANGGVWESRDRGASWTPRTDYQATLTVGALAFDPSSPSTAYCGTGEGDWWSFLGNGVLRSADGGASWTVAATSPFVGQGFHALVVDPADGSRLLAGTTGGLFTSTDRGTTWTRRRSARTWAFGFNPRGGVVAACSDGLQHSTDQGVTWQAVALPGAPAGFDRLAVAVAPSDRTIAYAFGTGAPYSDAGPTGYLWRRSAGTWTAMGTPPGLATGQSWYDWYVAVSPDNANQVYCGAIEVHRGDLSGRTWTWQTLSNKGASGDSIHPDQHSIAFEPGRADTVYAGGDGGLFRSDDRGTTWHSCNNGMAVSEFEYIAHDWGSSRWLIGGTQDNGTNRWTGSGTWEHVEDADGGDVCVNRTTPATVVHSRQNGALLRSTTGGGFGSWGFVTPTLPTGEGLGLFYPPVESSATTGSTVALGMRALYVSRDNGTTWTRLGFPSAGIASAMYVPDPDTVLVALTDGRVLRTRFSTSWSTLTALTTPRAGAWISDLYAEPGGGGRLVATSTRTGGGRFFVSDDGGTTWADRTAGLPALPLNAVAVDDANRARMWVAADLGVYQSWDAGVTWASYAPSLPNAFVGDLVFHPHARVLRAGTRNRGVWEIPVDGWMTSPWCGTQWTGSLAPQETRRWFTFGWPATWHVLWTVMPTSVAVGAPQVTWRTQVERADAEHVTYWISVTNLTASPVTFEGRFAVLSRY